MPTPRSSAVNAGKVRFVGAGSVVTRDVPDYALVVGNPARIHAWVCYCGIKLPLGTTEHGREEASCPECSRRYRRVGRAVEQIDQQANGI